MTSAKYISQSDSFQVIPTAAIQGLPCGETQTLAPPEIARAHLSRGTQVVLSFGGGASFKFPCLRRRLAIRMLDVMLRFGKVWEVVGLGGGVGGSAWCLPCQIPDL